MQVGSLVRINKSYSQKCVGKLAIVMKVYPWNATIYIIEFQKTETYGLTKLEVL